MSDHVIGSENSLGKEKENHSSVLKQWTASLAEDSAMKLHLVWDLKNSS